VKADLGHPEPMSDPTTRQADVAVVGAGPAGAAAATIAARAGLRTIAVDRARFPRDKCCGDGLTVGALRLLQHLGLDPAAIPSWTPVEDATVSSPSHRAVVFPLPRGQGLFAAVARRTDLDAALVDTARRAGVTVVEGNGVTDVRADDAAVVVTLADRTTIHAPYVIAADGMWSPTRKLLGVSSPDYRGEWHAFRQYFRNVSPRAERELMVWFEPDFLPGYAWSFPLGDGRANVGFGIQRGTSYAVGDMKFLWPDVLARPNVRAFLGEHAEPEGPHKAWPIPAGVDRLTPAHGRVLFAGDAVAASDPMTGEGIGQALATGIWAAEAVVAVGPGNPAGARAQYARRLSRDLVPDQRMSRVLVGALRHRKGARAAVWVASLTPWTRRNFARWLFEDYPRALLLTPGRWRRGMLSGRGAFADGSSARNLAATSEP
jgi:geranylgeranyl reductase family protein